jgi:hypothetical protein
MLGDEYWEEAKDARLYWSQMVDMRPRIERQGEWMPANSMKPPRPKSIETNGVLPSIYGIGFWEPVFEDSVRTQ